MDAKYLENQAMRQKIKKETLLVYHALKVSTLYDYIVKRFETEEVSLDKISHLGFTHNLRHFQDAAINLNKIEFSDGEWHFLKIKQTADSALYYSEPLIKTDGMLLFFYEKVTNYWGCNGQLLYKELNVLPCNPYRALVGWNEDEEWDMYIDHRILAL